uniref:Zinc finger PMZ-type domain-containing protein n=1 Tax=Fagus sylvatica TaxID=28930 RepID=A0A2N9E234_FAGSY
MYAEQPEYTPLMVSEAVLLLTNDEVEDGDINVDNVAEGVGGEVEGKDINVDNVADVVGEGLGGDGFFDDDEYDQADGLASPINSEDGDDNPRFPEFRVEVDMSNPTFKIEMLFNDHLEFKEGNKRNIKSSGVILCFLVKNESGRGLVPALSGLVSKGNTRHAFSIVPKCDMLLNNLCEVFNSKLIMARDKSLLTMCEMIRRYLMTRIVKNREAMNKVSGPLCPRIQDKLNINKIESKDCKTWFAGGNKFEVTCKRKQYIVDIEAKKCACYKWDLTGIPCKNAISAIAHKKHILEDYVDDYFKVETYHRVYSHLIEPTNDEEL